MPTYLSPPRSRYIPGVCLVSIGVYKRVLDTSHDQETPSLLPFIPPMHLHSAGHNKEEAVGRRDYV